MPSRLAPPPSAQGSPAEPRRLPRWVAVLAFFLSALLFMSGFLAIFAPLPLLVLRLHSGRTLGLLATAVNAACVGFAAGSVSFEVFLIFIVPIAIGMPELLIHHRSVERTIATTLFAMLLSAIGVGVIHAQVTKTNPVSQIRTEIHAVVDQVERSVRSRGGDVATEFEPEDLKHRIMVEMPSGIAIFSLVLAWANLLLVLRLNPRGIRERMALGSGFFLRWKAPEFLVWPTIAAGALVLWNTGLASEVGLNAFKFLMAIYALQGLSILSFLFDVWKIRGVIRTSGYIIAVALMMPLLLSLGFFDLWFDFRGKLRQS